MNLFRITGLFTRYLDLNTKKENKKAHINLSN